MQTPLEHVTKAGPHGTTGTIGQTPNGRPIEVVTAGQPQAALRILFVAGQHGDEPLAKQCVADFASHCQSVSQTANVAFALIASSNPDGAAQDSRSNAQGIDLNRDHQLLQSAEAQSLHRYVRCWRPHLIVDVHTYPPRRKHLRRQGLVYCHDVFVDCPNNPSIRLSENLIGPDQAVRWITRRLRAEGYRADRYTLLRRSGRIRHGTPDIVDARNQFALRYNIPTLLVEGRQVSRREGLSKAYLRVQHAMARALGHVVDWSRMYADNLTTRVGPARPGTTVPIGCRYLKSTHSLTMPFQTADGTIRRVELAGRYTPSLEVSRFVPLPEAYAVSADQLGVIEVLRRHGFTSEVGAGRTAMVTEYRIDGCDPSQSKTRSPRNIELVSHGFSTSLDGYVLYPIRQLGGHALAVFLEPASKYGLPRFAQLGLPLSPGTLFPILRCESI